MNIISRLLQLLKGERETVNETDRIKKAIFKAQRGTLNKKLYEAMSFEEAIFQTKFNILDENLEETMAFLDTCDVSEFDWLMGAFEDISAKYKSDSFIECIKRNIKRFPSIKDRARIELQYAMKAMESEEDEPNRDLKIDVVSLRRFIKRERNISEINEGFWEEIFQGKLAILNENLDNTIAFLDCCTEEEFYWVSNAFDDISEKYKSWEFIESIKRNMLRFPEIEEHVRADLEYAVKAMEANE